MNKFIKKGSRGTIASFFVCFAYKGRTCSTFLKVGLLFYIYISIIYKYKIIRGHWSGSYSKT